MFSWVRVLLGKVVGVVTDPGNGGQVRCVYCTKTRTELGILGCLCFVLGMTKATANVLDPVRIVKRLPVSNRVEGAWAAVSAGTVWEDPARRCRLTCPRDPL